MKVTYVTQSINIKTMCPNYILEIRNKKSFLPTWQEKTGKSGHMSVLDFLVCAQGCDTRIFQPGSTPINMPSAENVRNQTFPAILTFFSLKQEHFGQ